MGTRIRSHNSAILFVDAQGKQHAAIVTAWWGGPTEPGTYGGHPATDTPVLNECACNLVYVTGDEDKRDPYGRQLERATSVVHKSNQSAHGMYWCWPDEV